MKRTIPYLATLGAGLSLVLLACPKKTDVTEEARQKALQEARIEAKFQEMIKETTFHKQVIRFQDALDDQPTGEDPETLSKQLEAQVNIKEVIIKSREAQQAKYLSYFPIFSSVVGGLIGGLVPIVAQLLIRRFRRS